MKIATLTDLLDELEIVHITALIDLHKDDESRLILEIKKYLNTEPQKSNLLAKGVYPDYLAYVLVAKVKHIIK
jgi:hypothetical protein